MDGFAEEERVVIRTWEIRESSFGGYEGCGGWLDGLLAEVAYTSSEGAAGYGRASEGGGHFCIVNGLMEGNQRVGMLTIDEGEKREYCLKLPKFEAVVDLMSLRDRIPLWSGEGQRSLYTQYALLAVCPS